MTTPTQESNSENQSANIQYILDCCKKYEENITFSTGKLFQLYSQNDNDIKQLLMLVRDNEKEIRALKKEIEGMNK